MRPCALQSESGGCRALVQDGPHQRAVSLQYDLGAARLGAVERRHRVQSDRGRTPGTVK